MYRIAIMLLTLAALAASIDFAAARDGCGRGWYFNGYRCAPMGPRYYQPQPYESPYIAPGVRIAPCPRGYTWNRGACRPYRGY